MQTLFNSNANCKLNSNSVWLVAGTSTEFMLTKVIIKRSSVTQTVSYMFFSNVLTTLFTYNSINTKTLFTRCSWNLERSENI